MRTQLPPAAPALIPRLPSQDHPGKHPSNMPRDKAAVLCCQDGPQGPGDTHTDPHVLGAIQDLVPSAARELPFPSERWLARSTAVLPSTVRGEAGGSSPGLLPSPHLADNASNVLLVLRAEVGSDLHQHGWLVLTGQRIPLGQHLLWDMRVAEWCAGWKRILLQTRKMCTRHHRQHRDGLCSPDTIPDRTGTLWHGPGARNPHRTTAAPDDTRQTFGLQGQCLTACTPFAGVQCPSGPCASNGPGDVPMALSTTQGATTETSSAAAGLGWYEGHPPWPGGPAARPCPAGPAALECSGWTRSQPGSQPKGPASAPRTRSQLPRQQSSCSYPG